MSLYNAAETEEELLDEIEGKIREILKPYNEKYADKYVFTYSRPCCQGGVEMWHPVEEYHRHQEKLGRNNV